MTIRQAVVLVPLPKAGVPVVLEPPEGFPIWAGCMPSPCPYEWREGEFIDVPGIIVMWEERLDFTVNGPREGWVPSPPVGTEPVIFTELEVKA